MTASHLRWVGTALLVASFDLEGTARMFDPIVWPDDFPRDSRRSAIHYGVIPEAGLP